MIKVLVSGCNGKMGHTIIDLIKQDSELSLVGGIDRQTNVSGEFPIYSNVKEITQNPDVIIDFSIPEASLSVLEYATVHSIPMVIATTGFSKEQLELIEQYSKKIAIFRSSNMSFDINLLKALVAQLAPKLKDTDIEIVETHHNRKIDAPSGTAIILADAINESLGNTMTYEYNRHDKKEKRPKNEIGFSSIRGGNIVGEHSVIFFGPNESFEIKHTCYSRTVFAEGAIKACKFLITKQLGLYSMDDLVK